MIRTTFSGSPIALCFSSQTERALMDTALQQLRTLYLSADLHSVQSISNWKEFGRELAGRGVRVVVAFGGGSRSPASRLAAVMEVPVLGLPPVTGQTALSRVRVGMRSSREGAPVGMLALGEAGVRNAAIFAASIMATSDRVVAAALRKFREQQTSQVLAAKLT